MPYKNQYVIVNIWTNSKNKALPRENEIGHISITTPDTHISFWPVPQTQEKGFFKENKGLFAPLYSWPNSYSPDYEQECIMEGAACGWRLVGAKTPLENEEKIYHFNHETGIWERVSSVPKTSKDEFYGIKPREADFRIVLYSVDTYQIEDEFNRFKKKG